MQVTQLDSAPGEAILVLEIDDVRVEKHLDIASKRVSQQVNIPGFRKGKAPKSMLINYLGRGYLLEEAMRTLVPETVDEAVDANGLDPWSTPRVGIEEVEPSVKLKVTVPLRPAVDLCDHRAVRFDDEAEEVTETQVDEMVERVRRAYGYTRTVERASETGDVVVFSGRASMGDSSLFDVSDREFLLDPDNLMGIEGFSEALTGMRSGDEKLFQGKVQERSDGSDGDGGDGSEDEEVRLADVKVQVSEVKEVVLPDIDDDLAKTYGVEGIETLDGMRQHVRRDLEARAERQLRGELETKVLGALVEGSEFQLSRIIVEREGRNLLDRELQRRQMYLGRRAPKIRLEDIEQDSFEAAESAAELNIKRALVLEKIAELEQVEIPDDDVQSEIDSINASIHGTDLQPLEDTPENRDSVRDNLRTRRALDLVVNIARGLEDQD